VPLLSVGKAENSKIRFTRAQGALLANWLREDQAFTADQEFTELRQRIISSQKLKAKVAPRGFRAQLRGYQKEGLGWLQFLRDTQIGGILADDMGLGKTVQVLAHLLAEKNRAKEPKPSLVILPKSLLWNWQEEAARFAPSLKVLAYAGTNRASLRARIPEHDLVLVTYSILRQDLAHFLPWKFDTIVADEAQAIKNMKSISHQACMALNGAHRLALTGTPVENSLDDLHALLSFVNPGLFHARSRDKLFRSSDGEALSRLANALRPFILRRTKQQVLKDLPEKSEQVLHCELSAKERRQYSDLRDYYRDHIRANVAGRGLAKSKIVVLEALLRLRQAACHPGLVDAKLKGSESAKLEILGEKLQELQKEGNKSLVFSQFTSYLQIVKQRLDREGISYLYLDGQTSSSERQEKVRLFQSDSNISVFLISLKAGGVGLNLTAAEYVFILDP
jgi:SNF2 family DNA or RNA helicase